MERSLRARVRAGDPDAFAVLFDECARAVYNLAFRMTGNWSAAEEVVSLTFPEAWRLRDTVQPLRRPSVPSTGDGRVRTVAGQRVRRRCTSVRRGGASALEPLAGRGRWRRRRSGGRQRDPPGQQRT